MITWPRRVGTGKVGPEGYSSVDSGSEGLACAACIVHAVDLGSEGLVCAACIVRAGHWVILRAGRPRQGFCVAAGVR